MPSWNCRFDSKV